MRSHVYHGYRDDRGSWSKSLIGRALIRPYEDVDPSFRCMDVAAVLAKEYMAGLSLITAAEYVSHREPNGAYVRTWSKLKKCGIKSVSHPSRIGSAGNQAIRIEIRDFWNLVYRISHPP